MLAHPELITPSQDFLKPGTVEFIFDCINNGEFSKLPPAPIVRKDDTGELIAIDGHNLIAVRLYRNEKVEVHLASSASDGLPLSSEANIHRNQDLMEKFESVVAERERVKSKGVASFQDLIQRYPKLFP